MPNTTKKLLDYIEPIRQDVKAISQKGGQHGGRSAFVYIEHTSERAYIYPRTHSSSYIDWKYIFIDRPVL
jgi:hypothetical protein